MPKRKTRRPKVTLSHLQADIHHHLAVGDIKYFDTSTLGERGQVVVPSGARKSMRLKPGDKLAFFVRHDDILCMIKADAIERVLLNLTRQFRGLISPLSALRRVRSRLAKRKQ